MQRIIDVEVGQESTERLVIFSDDKRQEWRWPRRAQLGSANAKLVVHEHLVGVPQPDLERRLQSIQIDFDEDLRLGELLQRMRDAFDEETETASIQAARVMNVLYSELAAARVPQVDATLTLARLLFLMFGDDTEMWRKGQFLNYLSHNTDAETLHEDLAALFEIVDMPERERHHALDHPLATFRYINGGLFSDPLTLPPLTAAFRAGLIDACRFDWGLISPAIFGSMFQVVHDQRARRGGGEHYTSEETS